MSGGLIKCRSPSLTISSASRNNMDARLRISWPARTSSAALSFFEPLPPIPLPPITPELDAVAVEALAFPDRSITPESDAVAVEALASPDRFGLRRSSSIWRCSAGSSLVVVLPQITQLPQLQQLPTEL